MGTLESMFKQLLTRELTYLSSLNAKNVVDLAADAKFFAARVMVTNWHKGVPPKEMVKGPNGEPGSIIIKSAMSALFHILHPGKMYEMKYPSGKILRVQNSEVIEALQMPTDDVMTDWKADRTKIRQWYLMELFLKKKGRTIIGTYDTFILHVPSSILPPIAVDWIEQRKRTKAPALQVFDDKGEPQPAYFKAAVGFFETSKLASKRSVDGASYVRESDLLKASPVGRPEWKLGRVDLWTVRILDLNGEIGKSGMVILPDLAFDLLYEKVYGTARTEADPWMICPAKTMKNFKGEGIREKFIIIHRTGLGDFGMSDIGVSLSELISSAYTDDTRAAIKQEFCDQVLDLNDKLSNEVSFRNMFKVDTINDLIEASDVIDGISDDDMTPGQKAVLHKIATSVKDWIEASLPIERVAPELATFISRRFVNAFRLKELSLRIPTKGVGIPFEKGIIARLPRKLRYAVDAKGKLPKEYRKFCKFTKEYIEINLENLTTDKGFIKIARTPVVNGTYMCKPEQLEWIDDTDVIEICDDLSVFLTEDKDGDYLRISWERPLEWFDLSEYMEKYKKAVEKYKEDLNCFYPPKASTMAGATIPRNKKGEVDAIFEYRAIVDEFNAEFPDSKMGGYALTKAIAPFVGVFTNRVNDMFISNAVEHDLDSLIEHVHIYGREVMEGAVQAMKHDITVPFDSRMLGLFIAKRYGRTSSGPKLKTERFVRKGIDPATLDTIKILSSEERLARFANALDASHDVCWAHINALKLLNFDISWMEKKDEKFNTAATKMLKALIDMDLSRDIKNRVFNDYNGYPYDEQTNRVNFRLKSTNGALVGRYFMKGVKGDAAIIAMRKENALLPLIAIAVKVVTGSGTILGDGFTRAELAAYRMLVSLFNDDDHHPRIEIGTDLESFLGQEGDKIALLNEEDDQTIFKDKGIKVVTSLTQEDVDKLTDIRRIFIWAPHLTVDTILNCPMNVQIIIPDIE